MKHTISVLVENHFGVLAHVAGLFSARGFNIDSLAVGETEDPTVSRMTIMAHGDDRVIEQIIKQLYKLIDVIKVNATASSRSDILQVVNTFRAKVVDVNPRSLTVEVTGTEEKIDAMLELLRPFGIKEVVRTGTIALARKTELNLKKEKGESAEKSEHAAKEKD